MSVLKLIYTDSYTTNLAGQVFDQTGASIGDTKLVLKNIETQASWQSNTNEQGGYQFNGLPAGDYQITISSPGFNNWQGNVKVKFCQTANLTVELMVDPIGHEFDPIEI